VFGFGALVSRSGIGMMRDVHHAESLNGRLFVAEDGREHQHVARILRLGLVVLGEFELERLNEKGVKGFVVGHFRPPCARVFRSRNVIIP